MTLASAFKTAEGEAEYLAAYGKAMSLWPVPYDELQIPSRFGMTHIVVCGPEDGLPLVLLHGFMATLTMWTPNVADLSEVYRVYAIDTMGQPGKSVPGEPIGDPSDLVGWLTATLDGLQLDRVSLATMSFGAWIALNLAMTAPERVRKLVLLSPAASLQPLVKQFGLRGMLAGIFPTRRMASSLMGWMGFNKTTDDSVSEHLIDLMWLGMKHFRMPPEARSLIPEALSDDELRSLNMPVLLLMGQHEVIYDPAKALARARRLIPKLEGDLVPDCSHDMTINQAQIVNQRMLDFLKNT